MNKRDLQNRYILFDIISALIVWILFVVFRKTINDIHLFGASSFILPFSYYLFSFLLFPVCCVFVHFLTGFYQNSLRQSRVNAILTTLSASAIVSLSVFFVLKLGDVVISLKYFYFSLLVLFLLMFFVTNFFRSLIFSHIRHSFRIKKLTNNVLIIGIGNKAQKLAIDFERTIGQFTLIGFISLEKKEGFYEKNVLGNMDDLDTIVRNYKVQETIIALEDDVNDKLLYEIISKLYKYNIGIHYVPRLQDILAGSAKMSYISNLSLVTITNHSMSAWELNIKRVMDISISFVSLLLLTPFMIFIMIRVKLDSKGPIFYRQERIGRYGKPFFIYKFRTMYVGSEGGTPQLSSENDNRITPLGSMLRKYRIDEIPQFYNIIKGDMSLVGPRPERLFYITQIEEQAPYYCLLYKIRPGLTSWGPIKIGYSDSIQKMVERLNYDIIYLDSMSLINDLKIMIYTVEIILNGKGV